MERSAEQIAVVGSNGAIGNALVSEALARFANAQVYSYSRHTSVDTPARLVHTVVDFLSEQALAEAAAISQFDLVLVATGILHEPELGPEKSLRDLSAHKFRRLFEVNTILPALLAKAFIPRLRRDRRAVFAALSARVGSISDNRLGGWYSYRASKAALNMVIKTAALESARRNPNGVVVGLHPGTVASDLSAPYASNVAADKLFSPELAARQLFDVVAGLGPEHSGKCIAWDGREVLP
ncbi:MAG: SDR family NAD(P)-dependent oxidoreductase [Cellvibrionaceae bacterium]|nr:SDR family NAD(P)-dependent oxidoreductase [Cellvibrionaceae bacterium]